jgi:hypothetical protein
MLSRCSYELDGRGSIPGRGKGFFYCSTASTEPPIRWVPEAISIEIKRGRREANRSLPSSVAIPVTGREGP